MDKFYSGGLFVAVEFVFCAMFISIRLNKDFFGVECCLGLMAGGVMGVGL